MSQSPARILIIDDDPALTELLAEGLVERGFLVATASEPSAALAAVEAGRFDLLLTDLRMPGYDGLFLLDRAKRAAREAPVIVMTAHSGIDSAVECIRRGAYHYLTKPFKLDELVLFVQRAQDESVLRQESRSLKRELRESVDGLIGNTEPIREVVGLVRRVADAEVPVLVLGETGTGKGLVARALHALGARAERPFVSVNCAALPDTLLESELFGHVKGAFTGATSSRLGLFSAADGGTLFLDEIGEMSPALQAKLLHVLETGRVRPLGETREHAVDVRIVAATHRDLHARAAEGSFREDLLYRLDVISITLPPLRHRREDIPLLVDHFLHAHRAKHPRAIAERFSEPALAAMRTFSWPGNVRELAHLVERVVLLCSDPEVPLSALPPRLTTAESKTEPLDFGATKLPLRELQRRYVLHVFELCGGSKRETGEALGIDYKTLMRYLADPTAS